MINEARTLLLNQSPAGRPPPGVLGEAFIDPAFRPRRAHRDVEAARGILLGERRTPLQQNAHLAALMNVVHGHDPGERYAAALDGRFSYFPLASGLSSALYGLRLTAIDDRLVTVAGSDRSVRDPDSGGRFTLRISRPDVDYAAMTASFVDTGGQIEVAVHPEQLTLPGGAWLPAFTSAADPTDAFGFHAVFDQLGPVTAVLAVGGGHRTLEVPLGQGVTLQLQLPAGLTQGTFRLEWLARPEVDLVGIERRLREAGLVAAICRPRPSPFDTFLELFERGLAFQDRLAGAVLAVIYATREPTRDVA